MSPQEFKEISPWTNNSNLMPLSNSRKNIIKWHRCKTILHQVKIMGCHLVESTSIIRDKALETSQAMVSACVPPPNLITVDNITIHNYS